VETGRLPVMPPIKCVIFAITIVRGTREDESRK